MKYIKILLFLPLLLTYSEIGLSQTILKIVENYVAIDIDESSGLRPGDKITVFRIVESGDRLKIGRLEIFKYGNNMCAAEIVMENSPYKIKVGDFVNIRQIGLTSNKKNMLPYFSLGTGIIVSGLGFYFHNKANKTFEEYEMAYVPEDAVSLFDKTKNFDKKAQICIGVGGGLVVFGVLYKILKRNNRSQNNTNVFTLAPVQNRGFTGISTRFYFNIQ